MTKTTLASLLAVAAGLLSATPAQAATTGSDLAAAPTTTLGCAAPCTLAWGAEGWFDTPLREDEIVTRWSAHLAPGTKARLRVLRRNTDGTYTGAGASERVTGSATGGLQTFTTHLPVPGPGHRIGVDVEAGAIGAVARSEFGAVRIDPALGADETRGGTRSEHELLLQATTEGDADGDGRGDVTEDDCVFTCASAGAPAGGGGATGGDGTGAGGSTAAAPPAPAPAGGRGSGAGPHAKPAFQVDSRGLLRAGAQGRQGWFDLYVLNDSARPFDASVVVKAGGRRVGAGSVKELEGGETATVAVRLGARERRQLQRTGRARLTLEGTATLANGYRHEVRQPLTVLTGGDARYDGTYRGPGPFVLVVERGTIRTVNANVVGFCPETNRQMKLNVFTAEGFPALVGRDGRFDMTDGRAVSQTNTYRGRLTRKGTGKGYASAFKAMMNMSSGGRLFMEGCTGATNWTVRRAAR